MRINSLRVRLGLLGIWLGVGATFSFVVAPSAFAVLPSRELAGTLVSRVLGSVELIGIVIGVLLIVLCFFDSRRRARAALELLLYCLMTLAMGVSRFAVSPRLHSMRQEFGSQLTTMPPDEAVRQSFDFLHRVSVGLMGLDLLAAAVALLLLTWMDRRTFDA